MTEEKWDRAKEVLEQLKGLYPEYVGAENAYVLLATVYKRTSDPAGEHKVLDELVARDGDASAAYLRLMELDEAAGDWRGVAENARRLLAVNPLIPAPHRQLARAAEHLGERDEAVAAYRALSLLDDTDPAEVHYRLAKLLHQSGKPDEARREVLRVARGSASVPRRAPAPARAGRIRSIPTPGGLPLVPTPSRKTQTMTRRRLTAFAILGLLAIASGVCLAQFGPFGGRRRSPPGVIPEDRAGVPNWKVDEQFKNDVFTFVRVEYDSDGYGRRRRGGTAAAGAGAGEVAGRPTGPTAT